MRLILAYGNPLRGDDGAAWRVAEALESDPDTEVLRVHQLAPELADRVRRADAVLFIDSSVGDKAGRVRLRHLAPDPTAVDVGHTLAPATLLYLAGTFYGRCPDAALLTLGGTDFSFGTKLSPPVEAALPEAKAAAREALEEMVAAIPQARGM